MTFTALVVVLAAAWVVALGRQALPRPLRVPLRRATARDLGRDAARGLREVARLDRRRRTADRATWARGATTGPRTPQR